MIGDFDETFFILDALDECNDRPELLENLEKISRMGLGTLHILATSRRENDIEEALSPLVGDQEKICIQSAVVNNDIRAYIHSRIHTDRGLKRWQKHSKVQQEIEEKLMEKVDGMYDQLHLYNSTSIKSILTHKSKVSMGCMSAGCFRKVSEPSNASESIGISSKIARRYLCSNTLQH